MWLIRGLFINTLYIANIICYNYRQMIGWLYIMTEVNYETRSPYCAILRSITGRGFKRATLLPKWGTK